MPASGDCELIRTGLLGQPANSLSSLAFVVVGLVILRSRPILGAASCAVGVGSFVFHGPMPGWAQWAHDVSLAVLIVALVLEAQPWLVAASAAVLGVGFAAWPGLAVATTAVAVAGVVAVGGWRRVALPALPVALVLVGIGFAVFSRTEGPLCSPGSLAQGHAVWHVLGASALWVWSRRRAVLL